MSTDTFTAETLAKVETAKSGTPSQLAAFRDLVFGITADKQGVLHRVERDGRSLVVMLRWHPMVAAEVYRIGPRGRRTVTRSYYV